MKKLIPVGNNGKIDFEPAFKRLNEELSLIGMKLESGREQDLKDLGEILKRDNNEKPFELLSMLAGIGFEIDISGLLDAYERAHGMDWLDDFYLKNQDELRKYF